MVENKEKLLKDNKINSKNTLPFVSVIVPVYNDEKRIGKCIESLLQQTYPKDRYEIIIVDNNSTDNTREVIKKYPVRMLIEDKIQSSYAARNKGIKNSKGEILAFTDSDVLVSNTWIDVSVREMTKLNCSYFGTKVNIQVHKQDVSYLELFELCYGFPIEHMIKEYNYIQTCSLFVKKIVFEKVGLFDDRLISGGDYEFGKRVKENGFIQAYTNKTYISHPARISLMGNLKRAIRIGKGHAQLARYHPCLYNDVSFLSLIKIRKFLPPKIGKFIKDMEKFNYCKFATKIKTYLLSYIIKIAINFGTLQEFISIKRKGL